MLKLSLRDDIKTILMGLKEIHKLQKWIIPVTILDSIIRSISPFVNIYMSARIIDELVYFEDINKLVLLVGITIGLNLLFHMLSRGLGHLLKILRIIMGNNQEMKMNEKIINMDYAHIENVEVHSLRTRIQEAENQSGGGIYALLKHFGDLISGLITVFMSLIFIIDMFKPTDNLNLLNSYLLNIGFLIFLALGTILNMKFKESSDRKYFQSFGKIIDYNRVAFFYFQHILDYETGKEIRLYRQRDLINQSFGSMINKFAETVDDILNNNMKYGAANGFISSFLSCLVYVFVGIKALLGAVSLGNVMKYAGSIARFMNSSGALLISIVGLKTNNQYLQLYLDFLNIEGEKYKGTLPVEKRDDNEYEIEFRNVSFKYPGTDNYVLRNVSLKLNIGEKLAIVGMNGSGKTTFIKLLCRLYDPDEGEILLNGINIKKYDYDEYLRLFSIVFQDFKLFSFSLGQNVAASVDFNEKEVEDILVKAGLGERLSTMPKGVHTPLYKDFDEAGVEISGGEAQKIALARALYRDAPIIILDEPTAALDPIAEFEVYSKFNEIVGDKTTFYISHRLSSCRFCDEIVVFHEGRIIQRGTHEELLKDVAGKYYELWNSQAQYYREEAV